MIWGVSPFWETSIWANIYILSKRCISRCQWSNPAGHPHPAAHFNAPDRLLPWWAAIMRWLCVPSENWVRSTSCNSPSDVSLGSHHEIHGTPTPLVDKGLKQGGSVAFWRHLQRMICGFPRVRTDREIFGAAKAWSGQRGESLRNYLWRTRLGAACSLNVYGKNFMFPLPPYQPLRFLRFQVFLVWALNLLLMHLGAEPPYAGCRWLYAGWDLEVALFFRVGCVKVELHPPEHHPSLPRQGVAGLETRLTSTDRCPEINTQEMGWFVVCFQRCFIFNSFNRYNQIHHFNILQELMATNDLWFLARLAPWIDVWVYQ